MLVTDGKAPQCAPIAARRPRSQMKGPTGSGDLQPLEIMALLPESKEILLIVTPMSFDTAAIIDQNGTVSNAAQIASRSSLQPYLLRMMDKTRADNNGSRATAFMHRKVR